MTAAFFAGGRGSHSTLISRLRVGKNKIKKETRNDDEQCGNDSIEDPTHKKNRKKYLVERPFCTRQSHLEKNAAVCGCK